MELKLILLLAFLAYSTAGPIINTETCSRHCTDSQKFGYVDGTTYEYDYTTDIDTSMQGASEDKSGILMTAKVYIDVVSKCEMSLRLGNVRLLESDPLSPKNKIEADTNGEFRTSLEESPLAFSFQDGRIEELCTSRPEKTWVLNIKRGILSSIQNSMTDFTEDQQVQEADVIGDCKAEYKVTNNGWYTRTIKKNKDLLACVNRHGYNTVMQGTPYRVPSEIQSLPLVKSTHECTQDISKEGILQSIVCEEHHVLQPFSRESSGAVTTTRQSMKYVTIRTAHSTPAPIGERLPLVFVHANNAKGSLKDVTSKLNEICIATANRVQPDTPKLFTDLVYLMKALGSDELEQVYSEVKRNTLCPSNQKRVLKFFLDALPMMGNGASLKMMTRLISNKDVTGMEADMWLTTLSFIKDPTKDMLNEVKPLLASEVNEKAMLGVSSLINTYCMKASCENDMEIASMVSSIADKIGVGCFVDKNNINMVIISLRSLGNAGYIQNALATINKCITKKDNPTEVRLAAIQAFRRMPCSISRDDVMAVFRNREEDSELRIVAYLATMTCPSNIVMSKVRFLLESEEVNQVGSFVWSHLTNLMETSSPLKQDIRKIINNEKLKKEFNLEKLKYSRNYEASFFLEKLNTGAAIDSNLIWSSKSFLPRSAMTNITFDFFGHSVNLLEIGGRIEGLEYFLESYFGPNGYFQNNDIKETTKQTLKGISNKKMEDIDRQFGSEMDALKGDLYMRVFGNELMFTRFTGLADFTDGKTINLLDILSSLAKNQKYSFTQNFMFLDSSIIIPTISGFPLNLTVDGSATIDVEVSGKMDLRKLATNPPSLSINGYIKPSGSVQINSMMSVDAFVTKSGMKMVSTMHSSTSLDGHVELANGKVFSAQLNTPFDQMTVVNVKNAFFTVQRESDREQKMITANRQTKKVCSGDNLSKITGMELCAELQYPNASLKADAPYFPMTGPVSAGISLHKRDSHSSYNLEYKLVKDKREARARVAFSTPGSRVDRELSFDCLIRSDPVLEISMLSPWKKASIRGAVVGDNKQKQITGRVLIDNKDEYSVTAEWVKTRKGHIFTYNPYIEVVIPNKKNIKVSSTVEYVAGKSFDGEFMIEGISKQPIQSKVNLINKKVMSSLKTSISFEAGKVYSFETRLQRTDTKKATKLIPFLSVRAPREEVTAFGGSIEYKRGSLILIDLTLDRLFDNPVKVYTKFTNVNRKSSSRYQSKIDLRTPFLRTKGKSNIVVQKSTIVTRTSLEYVIPKFSRDSITTNSKISYALTKSVWSMTGDGSVIFKKNKDYNVAITTKLNNKRRSTSTNLDIRYGAKAKDENKRIYLTSMVRHELGWKASDLDINGEIQHLASGVDLKIKGSHSHNQKSIDSNIGLVYNRKQSVSAALKLKIKPKRFTNIDADASFKWNDQEFAVSNTFEQKSKRKYTNELSSNIAGHKTSVVTYLKLANGEYDIITDINMAGKKPVHMETMLNLNPRYFKIRSQLNKDYIASFGSQYKRANILVLTGEVSAPSRSVTATIEAKRKDPVYTGVIDIKWDASLDKSKQLFVDAELMYKNTDDVTGFLLVRSPLQNNKININRRSENAHFDIKSYGKEKASVDIYLKQTHNQILSSLTVQTTLKAVRYIKVDIDHLLDAKQYKTNLDINWKPTNKVSMVLVLEKPFSLQQLHGTINLKTPLKGFESSSIEIDHDYENELKSVLKVQLYKKSIQIDASAKKENELYFGHAGIKSDIPLISTIAIDLSKQTKGTKNEISVILDINGNIYRYEGELTHDRAGLMVQQSGKIIIATPSKRYDSSWHHSNTLNDVSTAITTNLNGDVYSLNLNGKHNVAWREANVQYILITVTPSEKKSQLSVTHAHRDGTFDTIITMSENRRNVFTSKNHLKIHNGELEMTGNLLYRNRQMMAMESSIKTGNVKSLKFLVFTPQQLFRKLKLDAELIDDMNSLTSSLNLELEPIMGKIHILSALSRIGGLSGNVKFITTFEQLPLSQITFSRRQEGDKMRNDIQIEYLPKQIVSLTSTTLFQGQKMAIDFSIATPFEKFSRFTTGFTHNPTAKGSITEIQMEYPEGKSYSVSMTNEYKKNYYSAIVIHLPDSHPITASIRHKGTWQQFISGGSLQHNGDSKHQVDLSFINGRKMQGHFNLKSTLTKDLTASFSHAGNLKSLQSNVNVKYGTNKPVLLSIDMVNAKKLKTTLKVISPFTDDVFISVTHKGKPNNFKSKAKIALGKKEVEGDLKFSFTRNLLANVFISTPFKGFRKVSVVVSHEGSLRNFKCQSEFKIGKTSWNGNIKSKLLPFSTEIVIQTPHRGYEKLRAAYTHDGRLSDFLCHLELSKNKQNIIGDLQFTVQPFILSSTVQTPIKNYRNLNAKVSLRGSLAKFETRTEITYTDSNTITLDTSVNTEGPISGSLNLKTPFNGFEELAATVTHSGSLNNFASRLETLHEKKRSQLDVSFTSLGPISGKLTLQTPSYELIKIATSHRLDPSLKSKILVSYGRKSIIDGSISLLRKPTLKGEVRFKSTFSPEMTGSLEHDGNLLKCKSNIKAALGRKAIEGYLDMNIESGLIIDLNLQTPFDTLKSCKLVLNHKGPVNNFKSTAHVQVNSRNANGVITFSSMNGIQGTSKITTPFENFRNVELSFKHTGDLHNFECNGEYTKDGKKTEGQLTMVATRGLNVRASLRTPYLEDIALRLNHDGELGRFQSNGEVRYGYKTASTQVTVNTKGILKIDGFFKTPYTEDIVFNTETTGSITDGKSLSQLTYSGRKQHEVEVVFNLEGGSLRSFRTFGEGAYNGQKISARVTVDARSDLNSVKLIAELKTPFHEKVALSLLHNGMPTNFQCDAELHYSGRKQHDISITFKQTDNLRAFSTSADIAYNGITTSGQISFDSNLGIEGMAMMVSPLNEDIIIIIKQNGQLLNFNAEAEITYSGRKQHEGSVVFSHNGSYRKFYTSSDMTYNKKSASGTLSFDTTNGIQGRATLNTPLTKNLVVSISHAGELNDFNCLLEVEHSGEKIHVLSTVFRHNGELRKFQSSGSVSYNRKTVSYDISIDTLHDPEGTVTVRTPFTDDIAASFSHQGVLYNFLSHGDIEYSGRKQHEISIAFQNYENRKFTEFDYNKRKVSVEINIDNANGISANAIFKTPYTEDIALTAEHKGELLNFNSRGDVTYSGKKQHVASVSFEHNGDLRNFRTTGEATYNKQKISSEVEFDSTNGIKSKGIVRTPYTDDMEITLDYQGMPTNFISRADISYSGSKQHEVTLTFKKAGTLEKFTTSGGLEYNSKKAFAQVEFDSTNGIKADGLLKTSFTNDMQIVIDHQGTRRDFKSDIGVTYRGAKQHQISVSLSSSGDIRQFQVSGDAEYNNKKIFGVVELDLNNGKKFKGRLSTPFMDEIQVSIEQEGTLADFKSRADVSYSGSKQHKMVISFKYTGTLRKFQTSGSMEYNSKRAYVTADIDTISRLSVNSLLQTSEWSDIKGDLSLDGEIKNFDYRAELSYSGRIQHNIRGSLNLNRKLRTFATKASYNGKEVATDMSLDTTNGIEVQIAIKTPFTNEISLTVSHRGALGKLESHIKAVYDGKKQYDIKAKFSVNGEISNFVTSGVLAYNEEEISLEIALDTTNGIDGKGSLKTSFTEDMMVMVKYNGNMFDFSSHAELSYGVTMKHELSCTMKHTGTMDQFRSFTLFTYNRKAVSSDISLDITNGVEGNVDIRSPYKNMKATVSHRMDGSLSNFRTKTRLMLNDKEITGETQLETINGMKGKISLKTPFSNYESNEATILCSNNHNNLIMRGTVNIGNHKSQLNVNIVTSNGINAEICIKTPFTKDFEVLLHGNGNIHLFKYELSVSYGDKKVKGRVNHEWSANTFNGNMLLETPILEDVNIEYAINGHMKSFESTARAFIGDFNGIKEVTRLHLGDRVLNLDSTLTTTLTRNTKSSQLTISHNGGISNFKTTIKAQTGDTEIELDASFNRFPSIEGSFNLQTPFETMHDISAKFEHSGSIQAFITTSTFQYAPNKKIEGSVRVNLQSPEKVNVNVDLKSPCIHTPHFTWRYSHDIQSDSVMSSTYMALRSNTPIFLANLKLTSRMFDFSLTTPNTRYSANGDMTIQPGTFLITGNAACDSNKITFNLEKTPTSFTTTLHTPFKGFESTQIRSSATRKPYRVVLNMQATYMSEIDFETHINGYNLLDCEGSLKLKSGFTYLHDIRISMKNQRYNKVEKSHIEIVLNRPEGIAIDTSMSLKESMVSIRTPWTTLNTLDAELIHEWDNKENHLSSSMKMKINQETICDVDFEFHAKQWTETSMVVNINQPKQMRFEISKLGSAEVFILANWNKNDRDSSCRFDSRFNNDWNSNKQIVKFRGTCGSSSYGLDASYERSADVSTYSIAASKDDIRTHRFQIETGNPRQDYSKFKLQLPSRTFIFYNSKTSLYGSNVRESSFSWDADRDNDKRITMKITDVSRGDNDELNLELELPSIGKDVKLDTQMKIRSGNVIYDGRTELKYSSDARKTLTLSSKLEDISGRGEKYNFLLGVSHPYTTVDVQTKAELGKSDDKLTAGIDIKYMNARRQTKNFALMTEIDRLRRHLNVQIRSPLKSMRMDASVESSPFKLSIKNMYDDMKPSNTELTVDPNQASLDFNMNYDIDNPKNILHVNARFSEEQGIKAELFRDQNGVKIVDSLLNLRLKTSKILHTHVQWRPLILRDLQHALSRRGEKYSIETRQAVDEAIEDINREIANKQRIFRATFHEEVRPYSETITEKLKDLRQMRTNNDYYIRDIHNSVERVIWHFIDLAYDINESWKRCPLKQQIDRPIEGLKHLQQLLEEYSNDVYIGMGDHVTNVGSNSYQSLLDSINSVRNHRAVTSLESKYQSYMSKLQNLQINDQISNIANQYTATIYNVRENINNKLTNYLPTQVYNLGSSAYKSWEVEENIKVVVERIIEEIKKDFSNEMSGIEDVLKNILKSKVIVYDLARGEIEVDFYLPVDIRTLSSISEISLRKYIPDMTHMIPDTTMLGSLEDYMPHMSLTGHAKIEGEQFTTFDGQKFDFSGRCSYILARDFQDGNFSIILNYMGRQNKKLIITSHQQNVQLAPKGKVRVDGVIMDLPYKSSEFAVFADVNKVFVEGRGFQVKADKNVNNVDIDLSGWYFGKTGGLLGTLNHERYDDMIMPNKQITSDAFTLGSAWQVQERCR